MGLKRVIQKNNFEFKMARSTVLRIIDGLLLVIVFIVQSVILSMFTVYPEAHSELPDNYVNPFAQKLLWLILDLICLLGFALACFVSAYSLKPKEEEEVPELSDKVDEDVPSRSRHLLTFLFSDKLPLTYIAWFMYALLLVIKLIVIFSSRDLEEKELIKLALSPDMLSVGVALSGIVFSLFVQAHHKGSEEDTKRNQYINHISYGIALEVLDTTSLLSFLIPGSSEGRVSSSGICFPGLTTAIILLSSINLLLPSITLYKLAATNFGELYHTRLEIIYNSLHFFLVTTPFFIMRVCLWAIHGHRDVIFLIKNLYMIIGYFRGIYSDITLLKVKEIKNSLSSLVKNRKRSKDANSVEMDGLIKN